jgi:hypothetical protein
MVDCTAEEMIASQPPMYAPIMSRPTFPKHKLSLFKVKNQAYLSAVYMFHYNHRISPYEAKEDTVDWDTEL